MANGDNLMEVMVCFVDSCCTDCRSVLVVAWVWPRGCNMDSDRWDIAQQGWVASLVVVGGMSVKEEVAVLEDISLHQNTVVGCCTADYHTVDH